MKSGAKRRTTSSDYEINTDEGNDQVNFSKQNQEQQSMNEYYEEDDEEFGDEDHSGALDVNGEGGAEGGDDYERPKLAEGFYEIETVRRKRIRKGKTQYLIKWRDWPESANTWEPVENLMSCADFIDAFEKRSGKRGRKRKQSVGPTPQSKKKQEQPPEQHSPSATYEIPSVKIKIIEEPSPIPSVNNSNFSTGTENNIGATSNDSGSLIGSPQIQEPKMKNDLDITLPELKVSSSRNQENMTEFAIHIQEDRADEGVGNGTRKLDGTGVIRVSPRIGARRRKSGAVKRFTQDSKLVAHNAGSDVVEDAVKDICALGAGLGSNDVVGISRNVSITEILKPVNYSTSILNGMEDVSVSFLVRRSDGEEVVVDNKYLKEDNPLLLINFYEQHLRYSPSE